MAVSMEVEWLQSPVVTQDSINSLTATQGSINLQLPDPRDLGDFPVTDELERLVSLVKAKKGIQFPCDSFLHSLSGDLEAGEAWDSLGHWLVLPQSGWNHHLWRTLGGPLESGILSNTGSLFHYTLQMPYSADL